MPELPKILPSPCWSRPHLPTTRITHLPAFSTGPSSSYSVEQTRRVAFIIIRVEACRIVSPHQHWHETMHQPSSSVSRRCSHNRLLSSRLCTCLVTSQTLANNELSQLRHGVPTASKASPVYLVASVVSLRAALPIVVSISPATSVAPELHECLLLLPFRAAHSILHPPP